MVVQGMIDLRYHIVSIVAVFLALGLGILIGSSIVSDDLMVTQQQKIIDRLEEQFSTLREREKNLLAENASQSRIINNYENFSQGMLVPIVKDRLQGTNLAVVVSGDREIPANLINSLTIAGANVTSQTVILGNINMKDAALRAKLIEFYALESNVASDVLRTRVAVSVGMLLANKLSPEAQKFLEDNNLIKTSGSYSNPVDKVILIGGTDKLNTSFPESFDTGLINTLISEGQQIIGVESSLTKYSYMKTFQKYNMITIDNIDLSLGQISLVLAMIGEPGDYGTKSTAVKFMPSLPVEYLRR